MEDPLNRGIGTKEIKALEPMAIIVKNVTVELQHNKDQKPIGEKVVFECKHPEKEENIKLSRVIYKKDKALVASGTWFNEDQDGLIMKNSALAQLMTFYKKQKLADFISSSLETELDDGYLIIKAY